MSFLTEEEIESFAVLYRSFSKMDAAPSSETKRHLANIESRAGKLIESIVGANEHAVDAIANRVFWNSLPTTLSREDLQKFANFASALKTAAHDAREAIGTTRGRRKLAPRMLAMKLFILFSKHFERFSATADGYGGNSEAVAALLAVAHRAGDTGMTHAAARKWVEFAQKQFPQLKERYF